MDLCNTFVVMRMIDVEDTTVYNFNGYVWDTVKSDHEKSADIVREYYMKSWRVDYCRGRADDD